MEQTQKAKITLYWLEKSRAQRILWLLEELKVEYELKTFKRINMLAPPEFKEMHPLGKAPILTVQSNENSQPLVLAESGLIIEYLIDHYGSWLAPKKFSEGKEGQVGGETEEWLRYRYYMHYEEGTLMPYLVLILILRAVKAAVPFFIRPVAKLITGAIETNYIEPNVKNNFEFLENQISSSPDEGEYLCGSQLTGADIIMSFPIGAAKGRTGFTKERYPKLWAYSDLLESRESYKKAVQKIIEVDGSYDPNL